MSNVTDFYDELDLRYPEIAIAIEDIDRINPGKVKCIIPVLTPNLDISDLTETTVRQRTSNLMNASNIPQISDLKVSNYTYLKIPKELCGYVGGVFDVLETQTWKDVEENDTSPSRLTVRDANTRLLNANQSGSGYVSQSSIDVNGKITSPEMRFDNGIVETGMLHLMPVDRIIRAPSRWIVVFIGGDITRPRIIGRYFDDTDEE